MDRDTRRMYAAVAACAIVVYVGALWNTYAGDDIELVLYNELVHAWSGLWTAFLRPYWSWAQGGQLYRPLPVASFVLDWHVDGPVVFHAVNLAWHAGVSLLVAVLLNRWCGAAAALVGGVVFAVHPVHVEAVAAVSGRPELMAAAFTLLAVYAAVERQSPAWSTLCWALGLLSKENAVVAPALIAAAWAFGFGRPPRDRIVAFAVAWGVVGVGYVLLRNHVLHEYPLFVAPVFVNQSPVTIRLTAIASLRDVTRLLLFPVTLRADYSPGERTAVTSVLDARLLAGVVSLAAWVLWFVLARRRGRPVEAMGLTWLALAFAPVANLIFPIGVLIAERTLYLPSAGLAVAVGSLAANLRGRQLALVVAVIAVLGGVRTALRVPVWRDQNTMFQSITRDSPHSFVSFLESVPFLLLNGQNDKALEAAQIAIRMFPYEPRSFIVGGHAAFKVGKPGLAAELLARGDSVCNTCFDYYRIEADLARQLGDSAIADSLLAHAKQVYQR